MATPMAERDRAFWERYIKGRPSVPDSFFEELFDYHEKHDGKFDVLHEPGAGPAVHSARLASKFKRVIVSEPSSQHLDIARERLSGVPNCEFQVCKLEDVDVIVEASVDMVVALNMLHWTDVGSAMKAVAYQLRPGGSFAFATFAFPALEDKHTQDIWRKLLLKGADVLATMRDEVNDPQRMRSRLFLASDGDALPISEQLFVPDKTLRLKINYPEGYSWTDILIPPKYRETYQPLESQIGPNDQVIFRQDDGWKFQTDIEGLRDLFVTHPFAEDPTPFRELWQELEGTVGARPISAFWPVHVVLATRR